MKLYTEEQVREAIELSRDTHPEGRGYVVKDEYDYSIDEVVDLLTPIELPSDEEINEMGIDVIIYNDTKRGWFVEGLKFMRDKIQGGKQ
jgi:hypothetical protein